MSDEIIGELMVASDSIVASSEETFLRSAGIGV